MIDQAHIRINESETRLEINPAGLSIETRYVAIYRPEFV